MARFIRFTEKAGTDETIVLINNQVERYSRQTILPDFGIARQQLLLDSKVVIVGAGGLGCPIAIYLAAAGVGSITVIDHDVVALSNLHRQIAFGTNVLGQSKAVELVGAMERIDSSLEFKAVNVKLDRINAPEYLNSADLVIDGTDNFNSRFLIADACQRLSLTYLQAAVHQFQAQLMLCLPGVTPCYRCVFNEPPRDGLQACGESGVLGTVVGTAGTIAATEAIKFLGQMNDTLSGKMIVYNGRLQTIHHIELTRDPECILCSGVPQVEKQTTTEVFCTGTGTRTEPAETSEIISVANAKTLAAQGASLIDVREADEYKLYHLPDAISIPLSTFDSRLSTIQKLKTPAILYCRSGQRSLQFLNKLKALGIPGFVTLASGLADWH